MVFAYLYGYYAAPHTTFAYTLMLTRALLNLVFVMMMASMQFVAIFWFMGRARVYWLKAGETQVTFDDYKGNEQVLEASRRIVTLLKGQKKFKDMGGEVSRSSLVGPRHEEVLSGHGHRHGGRSALCYASAPSSRICSSASAIIMML